MTKITQEQEELIRDNPETVRAVYSLLRATKLDMDAALATQPCDRDKLFEARCQLDGAEALINQMFHRLHLKK